LPVLIERLVQENAGRVISIVGPPSDGKTTLAAKWAEHDDGPFAQVSASKGDT
jgi:DNA helicase TIP49 (TBP-interacting protein)